MAGKTLEVAQETELNKAIEKVDFSILAPNLRELLTILMNKVEEQARQIKTLQLENQMLRDENNRLKGEKGKPTVRPQTSLQNTSSESERKNLERKITKKSKAKNHKITITRTEICKVERSTLPADAVFKGCRSVIVQDMIIKPDNINFAREIYYSQSLNKTFVGALPKGYEGQFGPGVKAYIMSAHYHSNMTESAIVKTLQTHGILISACTVSRILTDHKEFYHQEKEEIVTEGLSSRLPKQMDDTGARVGGKNHFAHILCNALFTAYFTRPRKDRLTLLEILTQGPLTFTVNEKAYALMEKMQVSAKVIKMLKALSVEATLNRQGMDALLTNLFPNPTRHARNRKLVLEACAIVSYQALPHAIHMLLTDEAPQFKEITELIASCWVHEGRHYKKLTPCLSVHKKEVMAFLTKFWDYYRQLLDYRESPTLHKAESLSKQFDKLFSLKTGYKELDKRIALTGGRKESLLLVLRHPELPLHNNASELGARWQARKRDISLHTINQKGTEAKDTFMTIVETAKKHGINIYHYFYDRITQKHDIPSLANLIKCASTPAQGSLFLPPVLSAPQAA